MTYMSPLLQKTIQNNGILKTSSDHDAYYEKMAKNTDNLTKPNAPKARLVKSNPITAVSDLGKDCVNFKKAVVDGEISDNNLGRLNDLGLKVGSGLIAAYLAIHSRTKTDALMKFIGGGAFLASMSLWPKIFINLPMKLMHGVDPGEKYISTQGDKKDFYGDNQFILWDLKGNLSEEEKEKCRKGALQARALNLATVGVASPLAASLIGCAAQPKVYDAVVKQGINKTSKIVSNPDSLAAYMQNTKPSVKNVKEIDELFASYKGKTPDKEMFSKLADMLNIKDLQNSFSDKDDFTPLKNMRTDKLVEALNGVYDSKAIVQADSLEEALDGVTVLKKAEKKNAKAIFGTKGQVKAAKEEMALSKEEIKGIASKLGENGTISDLKKSLAESGLTEKQINSVIPKVKVNADNFFETIKTYNKDVLSELRGKAKAHLDLLNPIIGSKSEAAYTKEFTDTMNNLTKELGIDYKTLKAIKEKGTEYTSKVLSQAYKNKLFNVELGSQEHKALIQKLADIPNISSKELAAEVEAIKDMDIIKNGGAASSEVNKIVKQLSSDEALGLVKSSSKDGIFDALNEAIVGSKSRKGSYAQAVSSFVNNKKIDLLATKMKPVICANYELRLKNGEFYKFGKEGIEILNQIVYDGSSSVRENAAFAHSKVNYKDLINALFDVNKFETEEKIIPGIKQAIGQLNKYESAGTPVEKYFLTGSFSDLFKNSAKKLYNDKSWLKKFGKMAIILTSATLLIQPFFAKVKKSTAQNDNVKKDGGAK